MTIKTFTVVGVSTIKGATKIRWANDVMRVKVLHKHGHEGIMLIELPQAMTKVDAVKFMSTVPEFEGVEAQAVIAEYLSRKHSKVAAPTIAAAPVSAPAAVDAAVKETV